MSRARHTLHVAVLALLTLASSSCRNPRRDALRALERQGVEVSGASLLAAVERDDVATTALLLEAEVYADQRDPQGRTPLHLAIASGKGTIAWALLERGADLSAATPEGVTAVSLAIHRGETALAERLLDRGANPAGKTPDGDEVLPWAIRHGRLVFVRRLMASGADPHQKDTAGNPLLHVAIDAGRRDLMTELLELGADAAAVNAAGESAVVGALRRGWPDLVLPLSKAGADPNLPDLSGTVPLASALAARDLELARTLVKAGARPLGGSWSRALWDAFERRDLETTGLLLSLGLSPDLPDADGQRPALAALRADRADFLHLFVSFGADTAGLYDEACRIGRRYLAGLIASHGGLPRSIPAPFLDTPLGRAIRRADERGARRLLQAGARADQPAAEGQPPLHLAVVLRRPGIVRALIEHGADPNIPLSSGVSRDFLALVPGGTMRWLLKNDSNITPIMLAADCGCPETTRALLAAGARTGVWTKRNRMWPINIAARKGDVKMMRLILGKDPHVEQRRIVVYLSEQRAVLYDSSGLELYATKISTGRRSHPTPTGTFAITNKYRHWTSTIYDASMPCFQRLSCSDFGFHQGVVPGYPASHGCIRVPAGNAQKLFALTELGDRVIIQP